MFKKKITIDKALFERASQFAKEKGYSDLTEWVCDLMEEEMRKGKDEDPSGKTEDDVKKRLQGLGYIS
jgi:hypothetical protein